MNTHIFPLKTEADYRQALARFEQLFDAPSGTPEGNEAEIWATLIEHYETKHYPVMPPDPIEAIKFRLEQLGISQNGLAKILNSKSRASELLSGKRKLTINMMRQLHHALGIPAGVLLAG